MFAKIQSISGISFCALLLAGCGGGGLTMNYYETHPRPAPVIVERPVIIEEHHVCTPACHHYWDGARYLQINVAHRHGPGCGHAFEGNRWVVIRASGPAPRAVRVQEPPRRVVQGHVDPGGAEVRVFDRKRNVWISADRGHVHGPSCGHVYLHGRWVIRD